MNKWIGIGRLTTDPTVTYSQGEKQTVIARITLAVDRRFKREGEQQADFLPCVGFGKTGEFIEKYLHKGTKVAVVGRLQTGNYTNKEGQKVYTTDVMIEEIEFAESKGSGSNQSNNTRPEPSKATGDGFMNIPDGIDAELPFN